MKIIKNSWNLGMLLAVCLLFAAYDITAQAEGIIKKPQFDPMAPKVELFAGIESGSLDYKMIMKGMNEGNLIIENKTAETLTVEMPPAVVGIHVYSQTLNQIGGGNNGGGFGGNQGGGIGGQGGQGGGQQAVGGGQGGQGGGIGGQGGGGFGGGGQGGGGGGFFSVPAGKKVLYPLQTVCLEYGKPNPTIKSTYKLVKVEEYTQDQRVRELIKLVGTGKLDTGSAQAASWNITSNVSWHELSDMRMGKLPQSKNIHVFSSAEISHAQNIVATAEGLAREEIARQKLNPNTESTPIRSTEPVSPRLQLNP